MVNAAVSRAYLETLERSGKLEEYMNIYLSHVTWSRRIKRTTISRLLLVNISHFIDEHIETDRYGKPLLRKTALGGLYYAKIARYFYECKKKSVQIGGILCYCCGQLIVLGESCIAGSKGTGKKYYHLKCAFLKGVV